VGSGTGPFLWRATPDFQWHGQWFCRRCIAEWTRRIIDVTYKTGVTMTPAALGRLATAIGELEGVESVELRVTAIEDRPALVAEARIKSGKDPRTTTSFLVVNDGVIKL
jgi:hypothetical protein